jgi:hypothetical protein
MFVACCLRPSACRPSLFVGCFFPSRRGSVLTWLAGSRCAVRVCPRGARFDSREPRSTEVRTGHNFPRENTYSREQQLL